MKYLTTMLRLLVALVATAVLAVAAQPSGASEVATPEPAAGETRAAEIVSTQTALSVDELDKYERMAAELEQSDEPQEAAGATDRTVWIVVGVVVLVVVIAAAAGGGGY